MYRLTERGQMMLARAIATADIRLECGTTLPKLRFVGMYEDRLIFTLAGDGETRALTSGDNERHD